MRQPQVQLIAAAIRKKEGLMQIGDCGLCLCEKELRKSHLIPKALYKKLRNTHEGNDLVLIQNHNKTSKYTDHQITEYFLCSECEDRFSRLGEMKVIPDCYACKNVFPALQWAKSCNQYADVKGERWINPKRNSFTKNDFYLYYAASFVWRSSAWPKTENSDKYSLGKKYQELFRRYLLGLDGFPTNVYLAVYIDTDEAPNTMITVPTSSNKNGYHHHIFYVPGMKFSMIVGNVVGTVKTVYSAAGSKILFATISFSKHPDDANFSRRLATEFKESGRLSSERENV